MTRMTMKDSREGFNSFLTEAGQEGHHPRTKRVSDDIVTTFGRYNPPHKGHLKTLDYASDLAQNIGDDAGADQRFYASKSHDKKKNPLDYNFKMEQLSERCSPNTLRSGTPMMVLRTVLNAAAKAQTGLQELPLRWWTRPSSGYGRPPASL